MNVASLELCKELYELSGWEDTYLRWANFREPRVVNADEWAKNMEGEPDLIASGDSVYVEDQSLIPAYDLGYLLRKLPDCIQFDEARAWLIVGKNREGYQAGYQHGDGMLERSARVDCDTPEDAAAKLAIELFKQGVLKKVES